MKKPMKRKAMKFKFTSLLGFLLLCFEITNAQVYERSKSESRSFKVYPETSLEISNKYGNIHLLPWEKDSVKIKIDVKVKANKESKADKIFEYIDFEFTNSRYYIVVNTELQSNQGSFWSEVNDLANTIFSGNSKVQINYTVNLPVDMELKLENKFGNIYLTDYRGKASLRVSNGDIKANDLSGSSTIYVSFGNATINSISEGRLFASYADVDLDFAHELELESKSSNLTIRKADGVKLNSRRDKLHIRELKTLSGKTSFSYLSLDDFRKSLDISMDYGEINLEHIHKDFQTIGIQCNYTDIYLGLPETINCTLDINHTQATGIYYPDTFKNLKLDTLDQKADSYKTSGRLGNKLAGTAKIQLEMKSGKLVMKTVAKPD